MIPNPDTKVYFVTNICPGYRVRAFELLARVLNITFFFFSEPQRQKYWEKNNPVLLGNFKAIAIKGVQFFSGKVRWIPQLYYALLRGKYDVLVKCINGRMPLLLSFVIARARHKPFVLWTGLWNHPATAIHRMTFPVLKSMYQRSNALVVYGLHVRRYLLDQGVASERIFIAPQAVDNEYWGRAVDPDVLRELCRNLIPRGFKMILFVGRLERHKGLEYLLHACANLRFSNWKLVLAGTGPLEKPLRRLAAEKNLPNIEFIGHASSRILPELYRLASVLVLPSVTTRDFKEPWGLVINEAMNQGCPVIATDAVGAVAGGLVEDDVNGVVVHEASVHDLLRALNKVLTDDDFRSRLSSGAKRVISDWSYERMTAGFRSAIQFAQTGGL